MGSAAWVVLTLLGIVLAVQLARGTLGQWLASKFLNRTSPVGGGLGGTGVAGAGGAGAATAKPGAAPGSVIGPGTLGGGIGGPTQVFPGGAPWGQA